MSVRMAQPDTPPRCGEVRSYNHFRGFGIIRADDGEEVLLFGNTVRAAGLHHLATGQRVEFTRQDAKGRAVATSVTLLACG